MPTVDWDRTTHNVLTMEWIDGIALNDHKRLAEAQVDLPDLGRKVIQSFLRHALRDGFFHADMHPGNLFLDEPAVSSQSISASWAGSAEERASSPKSCDHALVEQRGFQARGLAFAECASIAASNSLPSGSGPRSRSSGSSSSALRAITFM